MKKLIKAIMVILISVCFLSSCSSKKQELPDLSNNEDSIEDVDTHKEDSNYPNVEGYPIEKDDIKLCKIYMDGKECFCDGYTKDENPDVVYIIALESIYDITTAQNGFVVDSDGETSFCACINEKLIVNKLGEPILNIDGEIFEDVAPEIRVVFEDYKDYCCSTLLLEKTLGASVTLSQDRSAAYIETSEKVDEESSQMYELDLDGVGRLKAKNKDTGETKVIMYDKEGVTISGGSNSNGNNGQGSSNNIPGSNLCPICHGTGQAMGSKMVLNPVTNTFTSQPAMVTCTHCGGSGHR